MQKTTFQRIKDHLLQCERVPFKTQPETRHDINLGLKHY